MKFTQITEKLLEGKKIRRTCWDSGHYWILNSKANIEYKIVKENIL